MRLEQLRYFLSVAKTHSMTKTSIDFYTTHQSISKSLKQLEEEMGAPLFERSVRGMQLTRAGERLLPVAEECVRKLHRIQLDISHMNRNQSLEGELQIYGTLIANSIILSDLLDDFNTLYPKVRYHIREADNTEILSKVALHKSVLGLVWIPKDERLRENFRHYLTELKLYPLYQDEYVGIVKNDSPLANSEKISIDTFVQHPIALYTPNEAENTPLTQLFKVFGEDKIAFSASSSKMCLQAVASGRYVSIGTQRSYSNQNDLSKMGIVTLPFDEDMTVDIMLATHIKPELDEINQAFVEMVIEHMQGKL